MQVEIWSDVVCPWCYLGKRRFEQALASFEHAPDVAVVYRSFELDPTAPAGVTTPTVELLASKYGMTVQQANDAQREMEQRGAQEGLAFRMDGLQSGNTRDAHRLLHLAKTHDLQVEAAERLHRAYFVDQTSIFDHDSLVSLAIEIGLDRDEVAKVLASSEYDDAVESDEAMARAFGVTGVPFLVIDRRYAVSGAQPADLIGQALQQAWNDSEDKLVS